MTQIGLVNSDGTRNADDDPPTNRSFYDGAIDWAHGSLQPDYFVTVGSPQAFSFNGSGPAFRPLSRHLGEGA